MLNLFRTAAFLAILMLADAAFCQDTSGVKLDSSFNLLYKKGDTLPNFSSTLVSPNLFSLRDIKPGKIMFFGKEINTEILEIKPNGDIYYNPSSFCDCDKCKSFKGMKFLINFLNN